MQNTRNLVVVAQRQTSSRLWRLPEICVRPDFSRSTFYERRQAHKAPPYLILPIPRIRVRESDLDEWAASRMDPE